MKLIITTRKGKQSFRRAGINFTSNPTTLEVVEKKDVEKDERYITKEDAEKLKKEAMLNVVVEKTKKRKRRKRKKKSKSKKK